MRSVRGRRVNREQKQPTLLVHFFADESTDPRMKTFLRLLDLSTQGLSTCGVVDKCSICVLVLLFFVLAVVVTVFKDNIPLLCTSDILFAFALSGAAFVTAHISL